MYMETLFTFIYRYIETLFTFTYKINIELQKQKTICKLLVYVIINDLKNNENMKNKSKYFKYVC